MKLLVEVSSSCYSSTMTNIKGKHLEILADLQSLTEMIEPFKERYFAFINANPCEDIPIVPWYTVESVENDDYVSSVPRGKTSLSLEHYSMEFSVNNIEYFDSGSSSNQGVSFMAEHQYILEGAICDDSRFFTIPYEYFTDPETWEAEVLKRVKTRNELAATVARAIFPNVPAEVVQTAYYLLDETIEIDVNDQEVFVESLYLMVALDVNLLPQEGEPGYQNLYGQNNVFLNTETGTIEIVRTVLDKTLDMSPWFSRIG